MTKCKVFGCKELSVLKDISYNPNDETSVLKTLKLNDVVEVDTSHVYWSWDDKAYYKIDLGYDRIGYVNTEGLKAI